MWFFVALLFNLLNANWFPSAPLITSYELTMHKAESFCLDHLNPCSSWGCWNLKNLTRFVHKTMPNREQWAIPPHFHRFSSPSTQTMFCFVFLLSLKIMDFSCKSHAYWGKPPVSLPAAVSTELTTTENLCSALERGETGGRRASSSLRQNCTA